jgi:polyisoprenoid-binding protein YceI
MRKKIFFLYFILVQNLLLAQIFKGNNGVVSFRSQAALEVIDAKSSQLKGVVDIAKNEFAFAVDFKSFDGFNSPLQKEHFHENYMETNRYPVATFKGKIIEKIDWTKDGKYEIRAKGLLVLHGIKKERIIKNEVEIKNKRLIINSLFTISLSEHNIAIPKIVNQKIAEEIKVDIKVELSKQ